MQLLWLVLGIGQCTGLTINFDKFITGNDWYYMIHQRTCRFIHCDRVYKCSIETSKVRDHQYNCTRADQLTQVYRIYNVDSQENGLYCDYVWEIDETLTGVTVMYGRCCKDVDECNQREKSEYQLAVMQKGLEEEEEQEEVDYGHNGRRFAAELYQILVKLYPYENVLLCPLCVMDSLRLLRSASGGITRQEITRILGANESMPREHTNGRFYRSGSAIFYDKDRKLSSDFKKYADRVGAATTPLPFKSDQEYTSSVINDWLQKSMDVDAGQTETTLDGYNEDLVIANVLEFNASLHFDPYRRAIQKFTSLDGTVYEVEMLTDGDPVKYKMKRDQKLEATIIEIPFRERVVVMRLVVPDSVDGLPLLEDRLTADAVLGLDKQLQWADVFLTLPHIQHSYHKDLQRALSHMGADRLFRNADLSRIYEDLGRLPIIKKYIQAAKISLNDYVEASGAAVGNLEADRVSAEHITVDRPFLFLLEDTTSKEYLLIGRIAH